MNAIDLRELPVDFLSLTTAWRQAYPGAHAGVLAIADAANPQHSEALDRRKREIEEELRRRFAGMDRSGLRAEPVLHAYEEHYRRFNKTYHVQLQLESILWKGKSIPSGAGLVEAMFMAEIENRLLTAGHDLATLEGDLELDAASGEEVYTLLRGTPQSPKKGDMMISDEAGVISSVVYGPDQRTQIRAETRAAVFTVYAPAGIRPDEIQAHLAAIRDHARILAPDLRTLLLQVYSAETLQR
jgi:DNA/RNA-binding domain of Phe-tRNA-synthetase-like protein